jgi:ATP-dependent helicase HrpA
LSNVAKLALATSPYPDVPALLADARLKATGDLVDSLANPGAVRDAQAFAAVRDAVRSQVAPGMQAAVATAAEVLGLAGEVRSGLSRVGAATAADLREQLDGLLYAGFIAATPNTWWPRLPVYLRAARRRLDAAVSNPRQEAVGLELITELEDEYARACARYPAELPQPVAEVGWLLEELRVSLFAQALGTAVPVSAKRVRTALAVAVGGDLR